MAKDEFRMFNPGEYDIRGKARLPDNSERYVIHDLNNFRMGYIYNKQDSEDCSFYSPYLMYVIGKKIGIRVPETELTAILHINIGKTQYKDSFSESSVIYEEGYGLYPGMDRDRTRFGEKQILESLRAERPNEARSLAGENLGREKEITVNEHISSMLHFLTTRGNKPQEYYTDEEKDAIKQELIDRIMFGLKFGIEGSSTVTTRSLKNATLDPYFLSSRDMYGFGIRDSWFEENLSKDDEAFNQVLESEFSSQYGVPPNALKTSTSQVVSYMFFKYPKQTEAAYRKLSTFTRDDLSAELAHYSELPECKRKFALRAFDSRTKIFDLAYQKHLERQEQNQSR